ncbi:MAG: hypothetical protein OSA23_08975 [Rhodospirillales bacterium]|nr:hypothetical protein [Rhodospirillales bacterium]
MARKTIASLEQTIVELESKLNNSQLTIASRMSSITTLQDKNGVLVADNRNQAIRLENAEIFFHKQKSVIAALETEIGVQKAKVTAANDATTSMDINSAFDSIADYMNQRGWGWDRDLVPPRMGNINTLAFSQGQVLNKFCYALSDVAVGANEYHQKLAQKIVVRVTEEGTSHGGQTLENLTGQAERAYNQRLACDELLEAAMDAHEKALERKFDVTSAKANITARRAKYQDDQPQVNQKEATKSDLMARIKNAGIDLPESTPPVTSDPRMEEAPEFAKLDTDDDKIADYLNGIKSNAPSAELNTNGIQTSMQDVADMEDGHTHLTEQKGDSVLAAIAADGISTRAA